MMKLHTLKVWNAVTALSHYCVAWTSVHSHLSGQMLDPKVKVKVKGQVDLWSHKVGHRNLL